MKQYIVRFLAIVAKIYTFLGGFVVSLIFLFLSFDWLTYNHHSLEARKIDELGKKPTSLMSFEAARIMLEEKNIFGVSIQERKESNYYIHETRTIYLSPEVYHSSSEAAVTVACHEAGHAILCNKIDIQLNKRIYMISIVSICFALFICFKLKDQLFVLTILSILCFVYLYPEIDASMAADKWLTSNKVITMSAWRILWPALGTYIATFSIYFFVNLAITQINFGKYFLKKKT
jgi:Zn-dependent membrane protease YugP